MFYRKSKIVKQLCSSSPSTVTVNFENKDTKSWRKKKSAYAKERTKQRENLNKEIAGLGKLQELGSISADTCNRYTKILEIGYSQKRMQTREKYGFPTLQPPETSLLISQIKR
jgi:hypothetical protein